MIFRLNSAEITTGLFKCPDDPTSGASAGTNTPATYPVSYGYNSNMQGGGNWPTEPGLTNAQFNSPASTVNLCEYEGFASDISDSPEVSRSPSAGVCGTWQFEGGAPNYVTGPMLNAGISSTQNIVHTGGSNYLLADGHVKWFQGQKVSSGGNSGSSSTANTGGADGTGTLGGTTESSTSPVAVATFSYT